MPKYKSPAHKVLVDGKSFWIRALVLFATLPIIGKVELPDYLKDQEELANELAAEKKKKAPSPARINQLQQQLTLPDVVAPYIDTASNSSLFEISDKKTGFSEEDLAAANRSLENLQLENETLKAENASLKAALEAVNATGNTDETQTA